MRTPLRIALQSATAVSAIVVSALGADSAAGMAVAPYDFNADGRQELVVGLSLSEPGAYLSGGLAVIPNTATTLAPGERAIFTQSSADMPDDPEELEYFGQSLASADFNADGFADLAVGSGEATRVVFPNAEGAVTVLYGSADGLTAIGSQQFAGDAALLTRSGSQVPAYTIGSTLAAGDFDADGFADLALSADAYDDRNPGIIEISFGRQTGLSPERQRTVNPPAHVQDGFGAVLALGDLNRDGALDLVEGAPGHWNTTDGSLYGHVSYCAGSPSGPRSCRLLSERPRLSARPGTRREAPAALAIAEVTGDRQVDLIEGVPQDRWRADSGGQRGAVIIRPGTDVGPGEPTRITQNSPGVRGHAEPADRFGASVAAGTLDRDRYPDIVVGSPGEDERHRTEARSGRVTVLWGGQRRKRLTSTMIRRDDPGILPGQLGFGSALTVLDHNGDKRADITVGSSGQRIPGGPPFGRNDPRFATLLGTGRRDASTTVVSVDASTLKLNPGDVSLVVGR